MTFQRMTCRLGCTMSRRPFCCNASSKAPIKRQIKTQLKTHISRDVQLPGLQEVIAPPSVAARLFACVDLSQPTQQFLLFTIIAGGAVLAPAATAAAADTLTQHHTANSIFDVAENEDFWSNVARYGRFFVTVTLGTVTVATRPFLALFKRPVTAVLAVLVTAGFIYGLKFTLEAMLAINEPFEYTPGSIVTNTSSPPMGNY